MVKAACFFLQPREGRGMKSESLSWYRSLDASDIPSLGNPSGTLSQCAGSVRAQNASDAGPLAPGTSLIPQTLLSSQNSSRCFSCAACAVPRLSLGVQKSLPVPETPPAPSVAPPGPSSQLMMCFLQFPELFPSTPKMFSIPKFLQFPKLPLALSMPPPPLFSSSIPSSHPTSDLPDPLCIHPSSPSRL